MFNLSPKAKQICKRNYKNNCGKCEIRDVCVAPIKQGYSGLDEWINNLNSVAEDVE